MYTVSTDGLRLAAALLRRSGRWLCPTSGSLRRGLIARPAGVAHSTRLRWPLALLLACVALLFFAGCQKDVAERYPTRQELQARQTRAWDDLAASTADRIRLVIDVNENYRTLPVFFKTPEASVFTQTFGQMLKSQLSRRGLRISDTPMDAIVLEFQSIERRVVNVKLVYDHRTLLTETRAFDSGEPALTREMADAVWERYATRRTALK